MSRVGRKMLAAGVAGMLINSLLVVAPSMKLASAADTVCVGFTNVSAGQAHALAIGFGGSVWTWGINGRPFAVQIPGLAGMTAVAAGQFHSLALQSDGTVWAWGDNAQGQLGDGTTAGRSAPLQVPGVAGVTAIAAGARHSLALRTDGTVWAWGENTGGQLGDGTTTNRSTPVQVAGLSGVVAITADAVHSLALRADGTVWAWGWNSSGQLGDGTAISRHTPVQVVSLPDITAVAAGMSNSLAIDASGNVWTWGDRWQQGSTPHRIAGLPSMTAVDGGLDGSLGIAIGGKVWAWSGNGSGSDNPVEVPGLVGVTAVSKSVGNNFGYSVVVGPGSTAWAWGDNQFGQLGNGMTGGDQESPGPVRCSLTVPPSTPPDRGPCVAGVVNDGYVGALYVRARAEQVDAQTARVCVGANAAGIDISQRLMLSAVAGVPAVDADAAACARTGGNLIPGPHPLLTGEVGDPSSPATYVLYSIDAYANAAVLWVCMQARSQAGVFAYRVAFPVGQLGIPSVALFPDVGPTAPATNSSPESSRCQTATTGSHVEYVNDQTVDTQLWVGSWQESATRAHVCVRAQGGTTAGGRLAVDGGNLASVSTSATQAVCDVNVVSQGGLVPFSVRRSSSTSPASVCVASGGTTATVSVNSVGGLPGVSWYPDSN